MRSGENASSVIIPGFNQSSPQVRYKSEALNLVPKTERITPNIEDSLKVAINEVNEEKDSEDIVSAPEE